MKPHDTLLLRVRAIALDLELSNPANITAERLRAAMLTRLAHALAEFEAGCEDEARGEAHDAEQREEGWFV